MKKNLSDYLVAAIVVGCSLILLAALTIALKGRSANPGRTLEVDFNDVTGIRLHSEVRYAGAPAGTVSHIRLLRNSERNAAGPTERWNAVRVTLELFDGVPDIPDDVHASISSDTLLSEKFIALSAGSPEEPKLAPGAHIQGRSSASFDDLLGTIGPMLKSVEGVLGSIEPVVKKTNETLDTLKDGLQDALPRFSKVADSAQGVAISADTLLKRVDKLVSENQGTIKDDLSELKTTLLKLDDVLKNTGGFVHDTGRQVDGRMKELSVVMENLKVVTTHLKAFAQSVGEKPNRIIFSGKPQSLTSETDILRSDKPLPARPNAGEFTAPEETGQAERAKPAHPPSRR